MAEYPLNKEGDLSRICSPAYNFKPCDEFCNRVDTTPRYLQTTMNVSIFLSKLLIHPIPIFTLPHFLCAFARLTRGSSCNSSQLLPLWSLPSPWHRCSADVKGRSGTGRSTASGRRRHPATTSLYPHLRTAGAHQCVPHRGSSTTGQRHHSQAPVQGRRRCQSRSAAVSDRSGGL